MIKNVSTFYSYAITSTKAGTWYRLIRKQSNLSNKKYKIEGWDYTLLYSLAKPVRIPGRSDFACISPQPPPTRVISIKIIIFFHPVDQRVLNSYGTESQHARRLKCNYIEYIDFDNVDFENRLCNYVNERKQCSGSSLFLKVDIKKKKNTIWLTRAKVRFEKQNNFHSFLSVKTEKFSKIKPYATNVQTNRQR